MLLHITIRTNSSMRSPLTLPRNPSWKLISYATNFTDWLLRNANPQPWNDPKRGSNSSLISNKLTVENKLKYFNNRAVEVPVQYISLIVFYKITQVANTAYLHAKGSIQSLHRTYLVLASNLLDASTPVMETNFVGCYLVLDTNSVGCQNLAPLD